MADTSLFVGAMSGTSLDGVDTVLVDLNKQPILLATHHVSYSDKLRAALLACCEDKHIALETLMELDAKVAAQVAASANALLSLANVAPTRVVAIGSHGQTVRHQPPEGQMHGRTLQIGDPNIIAAGTGLTTVADFRRRNLAHGGHGAPLAPVFHQRFFAGNNLRFIVNIGGMANVTVLQGREIIAGFDTGPGNVLLDAWIQEQLGQAYDEGGGWARSGKVNTALLARLLCHEFFALPAPKSTGRESFNRKWLQSALSDVAVHEPADVQATLTQLTVDSILQAIAQFQTQDKQAEMYVCGGGAANDYLLERLQRGAGTMPVSSTASLGIDPQWVECCGFAWLAQQTLNGKAIDLSTCAGGDMATVLGGVYHA